MTQIQLRRLHRLPLHEKIVLAQMLWEDVAREQSIDELPEEHRKILDKRLQKIRSGKAKFKSWEEIERKYKRLR